MAILVSLAIITLMFIVLGVVWTFVLILIMVFAFKLIVGYDSE